MGWLLTMVDVKLLVNNGKEVSYQYFVEGKTENRGIIKYNKISKEYQLVMEAGGDPSGSYSGHAFHLLRGFVELNIFPNEDMEMWY